MKKYIIGLFLVAFLLAPVLSKAQEEDIDPNPNGSECVVIVNNLKYKSRDANTNGEVSTLQDFLQSRGYLNSEPTGYFGINTGKAVKNFQKDNNFAQTGYVGSLTRAKIRALTCGGIVVDTTKPVISGVSGPQTLNVNQTGTWKVSAYDKKGGNLSYSVRWGDENSITNPPSRNIQDYARNSQSATFTHSYTQAGNYTAVFTVTNDNGVRCVMAPCYAGESTTTTLNIKVGGEIVVTGDSTPRVMYWWGKVSQHVDSNGNWLTDPDGVSGANLDKLSYCKKWFPNTTSVEDYKNETTNTWRNAGNVDGPFTSIKMSTKCVQGTSTSLITILSPKEGDTLVKGNNQVISWNDDNLDYSCSAGAPCARPINTYDIYLYQYENSCDGMLCASVERPYKAPYTIAKGVFGYSMNWMVGSVNNAKALVSDGKYKIFICRTGTSVCDTGNSYFRITSSNGVVPVISGVSGPQTLNLNQIGTWKVSAYDKNGGNLSYSVNWGDVVAPTYNIGTSYREASQSATFTHGYSNAGTYSPTFTVINSNGQSTKTILTVKVGVTTISTSSQIISTIGNQSNYSANSEINFVVKTADGIGGVATRAEGYNLQAYIFPVNDPNFDGNYITPNPADSYNASFSDGYWRVKMNAPSTSGSYNMRVVLYCSNPAWGVCSSTAQDVRVLPFIVNSNISPSITVLSPNGGESINVSNPITVTFKSNNIYPAKHYINLVDETINKGYSLDSLLGSYGVALSPAQINQSQQSISVSIPASYNLDLNHNYKIEICVNNICDKSNNYFRITSSGGVVPVVSGVSGPQTLGVSQTGTWTVSAYNTNGGNLSYSVNWGDVTTTCPTGTACALPISSPQQSATFTHSYSNAGTYNPTFIVTNSNGQTATTSLSVNVN